MSRGYLLLEGGAEFGGKMAEPDRRAIDLAGGPDAPVAIIPAAAAPDRNHLHAGQNGVRWFTQLGARRVTASLLIDRLSAGDLMIAAALREARLIYLLGGFPAYLGTTLAGSAGWQAALDAYREGAVVGGSSAGAMVLCQHLYDPQAGAVTGGLNLLPGTCMIPHHDTFGKGWAPRLQELLPGATLVGIDEETGMIDDGPGRMWAVYGKGAVTLYAAGRTRVVHSGGFFSSLEPDGLLRGQVHIRRAAWDEAGIVSGITDAAYQRYVPMMGRKPQPMTADYSQMIEANPVWMLLADDNPAGTLVLVNEPEQLLIYSVAVHPEYQKRGYGLLLLDLAEREARQAGHERIRLYTNALMVENIALYLRLGYVETGREPYLGLTLVHMGKDLSEGA
jgi:cyanophycinase